MTLFAGQNGFGWSVVPRKGRADWSIEDGAIVARNGNGYLKHYLVCQDFELELQIRTSPGANGGVFFRWLSDDSDRGHEIQILDDPAASMPTGSIYGLLRANPQPLSPGKWERLRIRVVGCEATVWVNETQVAHTSGLTKTQAGHIVLQMHKKGTAQIEFRDIVLRPLERGERD